MRLTLKALALFAPLLATPPAVMAQQQGTGRAPEGNLGAGAAMSGAQSQSATGSAATGATVPQQPTHSPRPPGTPDTPARQRPEGNLGSGAAMSGAQSQSTGGSPSTGGTTVPQPSTQSPR